MKGDWFELLKRDFKFIGLEMDEKDIAMTPKNEYKIKIKKLVEQGAFEFMIKLKMDFQKLKMSFMKPLVLKST